MLEPPGPHFLNVDLDILGNGELAALGEALEHRSVVLFAGRAGRKFRVSIETGRTYLSPESTIWGLLRLMASLPLPLQTIWARAHSRTFSIGYSAGSELEEYHQTKPNSGVWKRKGPLLAQHQAIFSPRLLRALADVDARIETIIYPASRQVSPRRRRDR